MPRGRNCLRRTATTSCGVLLNRSRSKTRTKLCCTTPPVMIHQVLLPLRVIDKVETWLNFHSYALHQVLPLNGYLMAWLVHGITAKESLEWQNTPGVSAELNFSLRHFEPGMSFPSFTRNLCLTVHVLLGSRPCRHPNSGRN